MNMEPFETYLKYMKWALLSCGYWPFLPSKFILFQLIFIGMIDITWTVPIVLKLCQNYNDFTYLVDNLAFGFLAVLIWITYGNQLYTFSQLKDIYIKLFEDFEIARKKETYFKIMIKYVKITQVVSIVYLSYTGVVLVMYFNEAWIQIIIREILNSNNATVEKTFVLDSNYYFFNASDYYALTTLHMFVGGYFCIEPFVCIDLLLFCASGHICGQYNLLKYKLLKINYDEDTGEKIVDDNEININVKNCIKDYHRVSEFINLINEFFSTYLFVLCLIVIALSTLYCSLIVLNKDNTELLVRGSLTVVAQLVHVFFNCFSGQMVLNETERFVNYIYDFEWYSVSPKIQKSIWLLMLSSVNEPQIHVGKNFCLSFEFYSTIIKSMFSYLNVLNSRQN
ncbi:odorant receptor 22c-like [Leptopilina heterotoma]|uniref:odorant receptor 22c-like n=1 Tax=Leptopilina heterotoma TaxID=63436 RepID=UPI001CAA3BF7|nr:odorant receptor 22c-like [Leptopilina heterotoma]